MLFSVLFIILLIISTEATTEIISKSELFDPVRSYLFKKGKSSKLFNFLHRLIDCGYCTSVWVAAFMVSGILLFPQVFLILCVVLSVHRMANVCHSIIDRLNNFDELEMKR